MQIWQHRHKFYRQKKIAICILVIIFFLCRHFFLCSLLCWFIPSFLFSCAFISSFCVISSLVCCLSSPFWCECVEERKVQTGWFRFHCMWTKFNICRIMRTIYNTGYNIDLSLFTNNNWNVKQPIILVRLNTNVVSRRAQFQKQKDRNLTNSSNKHTFHYREDMEIWSSGARNLKKKWSVSGSLVKHNCQLKKKKEKENECNVLYERFILRM